MALRIFRNEVTWRRTAAHNDSAVYGSVHDIMLYYSKSNSFTHNEQYQPYSDEYLKRYKHIDENGKRFLDRDLTAGSLSGGGYQYEWNGITRVWRCPFSTMQEYHESDRLYYTRNGMPRLKQFLDEMSGVPMQDVWVDIPPINSQAKERLRYPTQKPEALLERIIKASSNEGDVVLDTFCGCGTAVAVAQRLNRRWIGVDITHLAIALLKYRLDDAFGDDVKYEVIGEPKDSESAKALAIQDRYQFQWWALSLIRARPYQGKKKGADEGVDGMIYYQDVDPDNPKKTLTQKIVVQVKSGKVSVRDIRELKSVVETQDAVIGVFITLNPPTQPMVKEAATAGRFQWLHVTHTTYPKIQIRTVEELLAGNGIEYPQTPIDVTFRRAERAALPSQQLEIEA